MPQTYFPVNMRGTTEGLLVLSNGRFFRGKLRGAPLRLQVKYFSPRQ